MKILRFILYLSLNVIFSQTNSSVDFLGSEPIEANTIVRQDKFGTLYYFNNDTLFAKGAFGNLEYSNLQLGNISSVNAFNPLRICLFYDDFNSVIILDNRLAEIKKIDFNVLKPFRDISHISVAYDNDLWLYNINTQQLELFNYKKNKTKLRTLPLEGDVLSMSSNYNYCWLLTSEYLYKYSYFGTLLYKENNNGYETIKTDGNTIYLLKNNTLFYRLSSQDDYIGIDIPELLIKQFFVTNETLYIYDGKNLNQYQLKN